MKLIVKCSNCDLNTEHVVYPQLIGDKVITITSCSNCGFIQQIEGERKVIPNFLQRAIFK